MHKTSLVELVQGFIDDTFTKLEAGEQGIAMPEVQALVREAMNVWPKNEAL